MERKEIEVFSEEPNHAIVRMPGRAFPGSVMQGDSLSSHHALARSIRDRAARLSDVGLLADASELVDLLETRVRHYEHVMAAHKIVLPYIGA